MNLADSTQRPGVDEEFVEPPAREFSLTWTLPKCIGFFKMGGKVNAVISKVFRVQILRIWRQFLKIQNGGSNVVISHTMFQWILDSFDVINLKTLTWGFLRLAMTILESDFKN